MIINFIKRESAMEFEARHKAKNLESKVRK